MSKARERTDGASSRAKKLMAVEVNGERLIIDPQAQTLRERQLMRAELGKLTDPDYMDAIAGQVWVAMRRNDPSIEFSDVYDSMTVADVNGLETVDPEPDDPE
jgi:hypothetical protein